MLLTSVMDPEKTPSTSYTSHDIKSKISESALALELRERSELKNAKTEAENTLRSLETIIEVFSWRESLKEDDSNPQVHVNKARVKLEEAKRKLETLLDPKEVMELERSVKKTLLYSLIHSFAFLDS